MESKTFSIPNISCNHCIMSIKNELSELSGVSSVEGNAADKSITVEWFSPLSEDDIKKVLRTINYPAE